MTASSKSDPRLLFLAGSARQNSFNKRLARLGAQISEANSIPSTFVDLADYPMPIYDGDVEAESGPPENARKLKNLMRAHTGIFIASPEYNAAFSPLLKNTIDWVSHTRDEGEAPLEVFRTRVFALGSASEDCADCRCFVSYSSLALAHWCCRISSPCREPPMPTMSTGI